jgi:hypothetical protein
LQVTEKEPPSLEGGILNAKFKKLKWKREMPPMMEAPDASIWP